VVHQAVGQFSVGAEQLLLVQVVGRESGGAAVGVRALRIDLYG
jgi:hypothetical protein